MGKCRPGRSDTDSESRGGVTEKAVGKIADKIDRMSDKLTELAEAIKASREARTSSVKAEMGAQSPARGHRGARSVVEGHALTADRQGISRGNAHHPGNSKVGRSHYRGPSHRRTTVLTGAR